MTGRSLRMSPVEDPLPGMPTPGDRNGRFAPSVERSELDRERRHRERAIAAWLRDLSRR